MKENKQTQPNNWKEGRRIRAWELKKLGWKNQEIAEALGVSKGAVSQWMKRGENGGIKKLRSKPRPGRKPKLSVLNRIKLAEKLKLGPEHFGFRGEIWNCKRIAWVIKKEFGVIYHPNHVNRVMKAMGWSLQKPKEQDTRRDEIEVNYWYEHKWPEIKKSSTRGQNNSFIR
jgi:transposase